MNKFDFEDINLIPRFFELNSRSECDTSIIFGGNKFKLPVVPANMESVIDESLAEKLSKNGYFYIYHRFGTDAISFVERMKKQNLIASISIGVNDDSYELVENLIQKSLIPDYITIDIAHGHSQKMSDMIKFLKSRKVKSFIIAGNVSSPEATIDLQNWGADAVKVGIAPGSACTTWPTTGFGSRNCQASTILNCSKVATVPIIADGGIKAPGDISKSLVLGASMVMIGGMFSGFNDSPGNIVNVGGTLKKEFWGSASNRQSGKTNRIEGKTLLVDYKDRSILDEMKYLEECLQSSISYAGGKSIEDFNKVNWL
jgi:GMP reductase